MAAEAARRVRRLGAIIATALLSACASDSSYAPPTSSRSWTPPAISDEWRQLATEGPQAPSSIGASSTVDAPIRDEVYELPALIDLAQLNNPATRVAWSQARQAASAIGLTEAAYMPMLSATAITGYVSTRRRLPDVLGHPVRVNASDTGAAGLLTLEWLLFDFGQRDLAHQAARDLSLGANFMFNAMHQQLAYDVTRTYYAYGAARARSQIALETLANSEAVLAAAQAKRASGLATTVEVAQARQLVAQAALQRVTADGARRNAYQALLVELGVPHDTQLQIADSTATALPLRHELPEGGVLQRALADRPDIMASIAALKAAEKTVGVARADFLPKVFLGGFVVGGNNELTVGPFSGLHNSGTSRGIMLGMTLPLYDGGIRRSRMYDAQERVTAAQATLEKLRNTALSEIIIASNLLDDALQSHEAATTLVETTSVTYQAALESYQQGVGTITVATEAASLLLMARSAQTDAHAAALTAAASLALALGKMDVGESPPQSMQYLQ